MIIKPLPDIFFRFPSDKPSVGKKTPVNNFFFFFFFKFDYPLINICHNEVLELNPYKHVIFYVQKGLNYIGGVSGNLDALFFSSTLVCDQTKNEIDFFIPPLYIYTQGIDFSPLNDHEIYIFPFVVEIVCQRIRNLFILKSKSIFSHVAEKRRKSFLQRLSISTLLHTSKFVCFTCRLISIQNGWSY